MKYETIRRIKRKRPDWNPKTRGESLETLWDFVGRQLKKSRPIPKIKVIFVSHDVWLKKTRMISGGMLSDLPKGKNPKDLKQKDIDGGLVPVKKFPEAVPKKLREFDYLIYIDLNPETDLSKCFLPDDYKIFILIHELIHVYEHEINSPLFEGLDNSQDLTFLIFQRFGKRKRKLWKWLLENSYVITEEEDGIKLILGFPEEILCK